MRVALAFPHTVQTDKMRAGKLCESLRSKRGVAWRGVEGEGEERTCKTGPRRKGQNFKKASTDQIMYPKHSDRERHEGR